jgi:hypothetical protein
MGISEACSPTSRKGSKVGSGQPLSPGARSDPGRGDETGPPTAQPQPQAQRHDRTGTHQEPPIPGSTPVTTGPED